VLDFSSDDSQPEKGFSLTLIAEPASNDGCNGNPLMVEVANGESIAIDFPDDGSGQYAINMDCQWQLTVGILHIPFFVLITYQ